MPRAVETVLNCVGGIMIFSRGRATDKAAMNFCGGRQKGPQVSNQGMDNLRRRPLLARLFPPFART